MERGVAWEFAYAQSDLDRFFDKVEGGLSALEGATHERCVHWKPSLATKRKDGRRHGTFRLGGRSLGAHRVAFAWFVDDLDPLHVVRHVCPISNGGSCVNPLHLVPGSARENAADRVAADRKEAEMLAELAEVKRLVADAQAGTSDEASDGALAVLR